MKIEWIYQKKDLKEQQWINLKELKTADLKWRKYEEKKEWSMTQLKWGRKTEWIKK